MPKRFAKTWCTLFLLVAMSFLSVTVLTSCSQQQADEKEPTASEAPATVAGQLAVRVSFPKGATSVGMASFASKISAGELEVPYALAVAGTSDQISQALMDNRVDIAVLPPSAAAILYNQSKGEIKAVCVNALGGATIVTGNKRVASIEDLAGKTVYLTDEASTSTVAFKRVLVAYGLADKVTLEYEDSPVDLAAQVKANPKLIAVLPQPFAAVTVDGSEGIKQIADVSALWDEKMVDGSRWIEGVVVVRDKFLKRQPDAVEDFIEQLAASSELAAKDPITAIPLIVETGILNEAMATERSIPACHPVCIKGEEMRKALSGYLQVLYDEDPSLVGGVVPDGKFYYLPPEQDAEQTE